FRIPAAVITPLLALLPVPVAARVPASAVIPPARQVLIISPVTSVAHPVPVVPGATLALIAAGVAGFRVMPVALGFFPATGPPVFFCSPVVEWSIILGGMIVVAFEVGISPVVASLLFEIFIALVTPCCA